MSGDGDGDSGGLVDALVAARPEQTDPFARVLRSQVRHRLVDAAIEPFRFGRFTVLGPLGGGGMGVVFVAYDPDLDRKIALKVLRSRGEQGQREMLREGRALARLRHPNVVGVYEVGEIDGRVFVAMEYVHGPNLREWLRTPRRFETVLARMIEIGRGLAAAHAVGLLHRDVKPDNLVIADDGHARVIDFGLARPSEEATAMTVTLDAAASPMTPSIHAGTPAYMAPERLSGAPGDARADQFAYCVTLWEALFGARPPDQGAAAARVPGWIRRALERGLDADPERRWPTMAPLLAALGRGRARARWRLFGGAAAALLVLAGAGIAAQRWDVARRKAACARAGAAIDDAWSDEARARLRQGLLDTEVAYAQTTAERVAPALDARIGAWRDAKTQACMNAEVLDLWTEDTAARAAWCLDDRELELRELVAELTRADAAIIQKAVAAVAGLKASEGCLDAELLQRQPAPPEAGREALRDARVALARAQALSLAGRFDDALVLVTQVREAPATATWRPLWAAARVAETNALEAVGEYAAAEAAGVEAYFAAAELGAWATAADAANTLITVVGDRLERHEEGRVWGRHADLALSYAGDRLGLREAARLSNLGGVAYRTGDYAAARDLHSRALAILEPALGPTHPAVGWRVDRLGLTYNAAGDFVAAQELHERAVAILEPALGPDHPALAVTLSNLANTHKSQGDYRTSIALHERAVAILERAHGRDHSKVAASLVNLASLKQTIGAREEALELNRRALAIDRATVGPDHPNVAISLTNIGGTLQSLRRFDEARAANEEALAIFTEKLGPDHPNVAVLLHNVAALYAEEGAFHEARRAQLQALATAERIFAPDHPFVGKSLMTLAGIEMELHDLASARALLERALAVFDAHEGVQFGESTTCFNLARVLVTTGGDRARAITLARRALRDFREAGEGRAVERAEVEAWLEENDPEAPGEAAPAPQGPRQPARP
ncbi:MAG: serine/threonine-protein kinase [Nannocystaceae bacterium]